MNALQFYVSLLAASSLERREAIIDLHKVEICRKARAREVIAEIVKTPQKTEGQN